MEVEYARCRAAQFAKALNSNKPEEQIISEPMNINSFINSLNINDVNEIRSKIIVIGPDDMQQSKPSAKEQKEQEVREEQRQKKKKKKKNKVDGAPMDSIPQAPNAGVSQNIPTQPQQQNNGNIPQMPVQQTSKPTESSSNNGLGFDWDEDF
jgi:hypothetical protein